MPESSLTSIVLTSFMSSPLLPLFPQTLLDHGKPCVHHWWQFLLSAVTWAAGTEQGSRLSWQRRKALHDMSQALFRGDSYPCPLCATPQPRFCCKSLKFWSPHYCFGHSKSVGNFQTFYSLFNLPSFCGGGALPLSTHRCTAESLDRYLHNAGCDKPLHMLRQSSQLPSCSLLSGRLHVRLCSPEKNFGCRHQDKHDLSEDFRSICITNTAMKPERLILVHLVLIWPRVFYCSSQPHLFPFN